MIGGFDLVRSWFGARGKTTTIPIVLLAPEDPVRNGCTIPFRENLREISKDIQDGLQA
jgi:hypothetical protein